MDLRALNRGEMIAVAGGALLGISLFLAWYSLGNQFTQLNGCQGAGRSCTGWQSLSTLRYLLLAGAAAPIILAWIVARGHALAWPRGEMTAVVAAITFGLTVFRGLIDKPGSPNDQISVNFGWGIELVGTLLMIVGAAWGSQESAPRRKPPGVL